MATLYLLETRAAKTYQCSGCGETIRRGTMHFRHDPHPMARLHRGEKYNHWCRKCVMATSPGPKEQVTHRLLVRREDIQRTDHQLSLFDAVRIELVGIGYNLSERLSGNPKLIHSLSPDEFEEFIWDLGSSLDL